MKACLIEARRSVEEQAYLLGQAFGPSMDLLKVAGASTGHLLKHVVTSMAIGSAISGAIGAYQGFTHAQSPAGPMASAAQGAALKRNVNLGHAIQHGTEVAAHAIPHHGLPEMVKQTTTHGIAG